MPKKSKKNINQKGGGDLPSIDMSGNLNTILDNALKAAERIFYNPSGSDLMGDFISLGKNSISLFNDVTSDLGID